MKEQYKVLVVDDTPQNVQFLGNILSEKKYIVILANSSARCRNRN